jgi:hypothetical protein
MFGLDRTGFVGAVSFLCQYENMNGTKKKEIPRTDTSRNINLIFVGPFTPPDSITHSTEQRKYLVWNRLFWIYFMLENM